MRSSNGLDWTGIYGDSYSGSLNTLAVGNNRIVAGGTSNAGTSFLVTTNGTTWTLGTGGFSNGVSRIRFISGRFWAMGPDSLSLKYSTNGLTWINAFNSGITTGALDIAFNEELLTYVVAMGVGAEPGNSKIMYSIVNSNTDIPSVWTPVNPTNLENFTCNTLCFGSINFVAGGSTSDGSSPAKHSTDGINWIDSDMIPQSAAQLAWAALDNVNPNTIHEAGTTRYSYNGDPSIDIIVRDITFNDNTGQFIYWKDIVELSKHIQMFLLEKLF